MTASVQAHFDAVMSLLQPLTQPPTGMAVVDGTLDDAGSLPPGTTPPATPYAVVRSDTMPAASDRFATFSNLLIPRIYVTVVGATEQEIRWALDKTRSVLLDVAPAVAGRSTSPLQLTDGQPIQTDRQVRPPLLFAVDVYRFTSA